jgi:hypothetical protein
MAQSLLAHGANRNIKDNEGKTAMDGIAEANITREEAAVLRKLIAAIPSAATASRQAALLPQGHGATPPGWPPEV